MALEVTKKNTLVDLWNISPADQEGSTILWSTSDETSLHSRIKNDITKDKLLLDMRSNKYHKHIPSQKIMEILTQKSSQQ